MKKKKPRSKTPELPFRRFVLKSRDGDMGRIYRVNGWAHDIGQKNQFNELVVVLEIICTAYPYEIDRRPLRMGLPISISGFTIFQQLNTMT